MLHGPWAAGISIRRFRICAAWFLFASGNLLWLAGGGSGRVAHLDNQTAVETIPLPVECREFYQAVEIGTSNFDTEIQIAEKSSPGATGLSVDAMGVYIDQLPNMTCWRKFNSAVIGKAEGIPGNGLIETYFIHLSDIKKYGLPLWLRGCNSVGRPHPQGLRILKERGLEHIMQVKLVPVHTLGQILDKFQVCRLGTFKVDVEGLDGELLKSFTEWVNKSKSEGCYADRIIGEFNELSVGRVSGEEVDEVLSAVGYKVTQKGFDWKWEMQV